MQRKKQIMRLSAVVAAVVLLFTTMVPKTFAQGDSTGSILGDSVPAGQTIENDVFLRGDTVVVDGDVEGDVFAVGRELVVNGDVDGSLFLMGERVTIDGNVRDSAYLLSGVIAVGEGATIGRSMYGLTGSLGIGQDSSIGRDLNAVSIGFSMAGQVQRNTNVVVGVLEMIQRVMRAYNQNPSMPDIEGLVPEDEAASAETGLLFVTYQAGAPSGVLAGAGGATAIPTSLLQQPDTTNNAEQVWAWVFERLRQLVTFVIVGALLIWLRPQWLKHWGDEAQGRLGFSLAYGFGFYILGAFAVAMLVALVVSIGFGFYAITLRELAYTSWGLGLSTAGVLGFSYIALVAFVSKVIVAYLAGRVIWQRLSGREVGNLMGPMFIGLLLYILIIMIPFFGWVVEIVVTFIGLGAIALWITQRRTTAAVA